MDASPNMKAQLKAQLTVYQSVLNHPRTRLIRWLLGGTIGYIFSPILPLLGHVDDLLLVAAVIVLAAKLVPNEVMEECRRRVHESQ